MAPDLIDRLEEAIRAHCADAMREFSREDLDALDTRSLVGDYASWRARFPTTRPRSIHESDTLAANPLRAQYAEGLAAVRRDIEAGADLTRYLSSLVRFPSGRDLLLAHAGVHHLHMSDAVRDWGRVERTEHVLFVAFRPDDAFFIDIYAHEHDGANWAERAVLGTIVRNWPEAGILVGSDFVTGLTQDYDDDARAVLLKAGVSLSIAIDGRVWSSPSLGATLRGAPFMAQRMGMKVAAHLHDLRRAGLSDLAAGLAASVPEHEVSIDDWIAEVHEDRYGFYAERLNIFVASGAITPE